MNETEINLKDDIIQASYEDHAIHSVSEENDPGWFELKLFDLKFQFSSCVTAMFKFQSAQGLQIQLPNQWSQS